MGFSLAASEQAERTKGGNAPHSSKLPSERLTSHYIKKKTKKKTTFTCLHCKNCRAAFFFYLAIKRGSSTGMMHKRSLSLVAF